MQCAYDPICIAALEEYVVYTQASHVQSEDADPFNFVSIQAKNPSESVRQILSVWILNVDLLTSIFKLKTQ